MLSIGWRGAALGTLVCCALYGSVLFGCADSGDSGDDGSTGGSGGSAGTGGSAALPPGTVASINRPRPGECMSAADCGRDVGTACATVAGAYRVCTVQAPVTTTASDFPNLDECGPSRACASGSCYELLTFSSGHCGNAPPPVLRNVCRSDGCASDNDCTAMGGVCGPRGFASEDKVEGGAIRQCLKAACKSNSDCTAQAGGMCALVQASCAPAAGGTQTFLPAELACVYPNGCTSFSDCPDNSYCRVLEGRGLCVRQ